MNQGSAVFCDDVDGEAFGCVGEVLPAFERVAVNGSAFGTELWSTPMTNLQPGEEILIDIFSGFDHVSRRYFVGDDEDTTPPSAPPQLVAEARQNGRATRGIIRIAWDNASDNVGVAYYAVFLITDAGTDAGERFVGARFAFSEQVRHVFEFYSERQQTVMLGVRAVDLAGNVGPRMDTAPILVPVARTDLTCRCAVVPTSSPLALALFALALTPLLRRRRSL